MALTKSQPVSGLAGFELRLLPQSQSHTSALTQRLEQLPPRLSPQNPLATTC